MLNLFIPPQINSLPDKPITVSNSGRPNTNEPSDQFSNILAREVSHDTGAYEKESRNGTTQEGNHTQAHSNTINNQSVTDKSTESSDTLGYKKNEATAMVAFENNQTVEIASLYSPTSILINSLNKYSTHYQEQVPVHTSLIDNRILLHNPNYTTIQSGASEQFLNTAISAAAGKFLPLATEENKSLLLRVEKPAISSLTDSIQQQELNSILPITSYNPAVAATEDMYLDAHAGQTKWNSQFAQKIVFLTTQHHQIAEIRLNPAHLGPIEVMLNITNEQGTQATVQFVSPHLVVRETIEAAIPKLREMMAENGIELGNVMVGADSFQQQENTRRQHDQTLSEYARGTVDTGGELIDQIEKHNVLTGSHQGIINTFA